MIAGMTLPRAATALILAISTTFFAHNATAQDAPEKPAPVAEKPAATETKPVLVFEKDLATATRRALETKRPLLVIVSPDWFAHPSVEALNEDIFTQDVVRDRLTEFVMVRVRETREREVHVRHRLKDRGYPLTVVLGFDGGYLGSVAGLDADKWLDRVVSVPQRHLRMEELRKDLRARPERPVTLLELARLHLESDEPERADALLERLETADRDDRSGLLGEARYLRLRPQVTKALADRRFVDVESLCLKWLRRFDKAPQAPDVMLLQANGRFLNGERDRAREIWTVLTEKHADTDAGKSARAALDAL
jgi:hypothetical protein